MSETCYSSDEEMYYDDIEDCIVFEDYEIGDIVDIWEADEVRHKVSEFFSLDFDSMVDRAFDYVGEAAEGWSPEGKLVNSLEAKIKETIDQWAKDEKCEPLFYGVTNRRKIQIKMTGECDYIFFIEEASK